MKTAAGLMMFRRTHGYLEVFLVHPGGPFWAKRDVGAWSIPKGEVTSKEVPFDTATREFFEETGFTPSYPYFYLGDTVQKSGKRVIAWAFERSVNPANLCSNTLAIEYPLHSGITLVIPEVDRGDYFPPDVASYKLNPAQAIFLQRLENVLANPPV